MRMVCCSSLWLGPHFINSNRVFRITNFSFLRCHTCFKCWINWARKRTKQIYTINNSCTISNTYWHNSNCSSKWMRKICLVILCSLHRFR
ncbi:unnamed protein product [Paramecium octaurelia]|uniref:Uncharacterized protein n=1 Tax=Paramecium octaurelia TaxID=43137 RepID=A0A8S1XFZ4_PAROT|nr:unnamed protein product [Paramecium octaurelia]